MNKLLLITIGLLTSCAQFDREIEQSITTSTVNYNPPTESQLRQINKLFQAKQRRQRMGVVLYDRDTNTFYVAGGSKRITPELSDKLNKISRLPQREEINRITKEQIKLNMKQCAN